MMTIQYRTLGVFLAGVFAISAGTTMAQSQNQIPLAQLEGMFANMRAKTKWNVDGPLLWGYFFYDRNKSKLEQAAIELKAAGYRFVSIEPQPEKSVFKLHVEKVEVHSPTSLQKRNSELYALAAKHALESYDGMDVGPATN
jgi:Regulator of ribonuclease activity B